MIDQDAETEITEREAVLEAYCEACIVGDCNNQVPAIKAYETSKKGDYIYYNLGPDDFITVTRELVASKKLKEGLGGFYLSDNVYESYIEASEERSLKVRANKIFSGSCLDEVVHDLKSEEASDINNDGIDTQCKYIVKQCGLKRLEELVLNAERNKQ